MSDPATTLVPAKSAPSALATASQRLDLSGAMLAAVQLGKEGVEVLERLHKIHEAQCATDAKAAFIQAMFAFRTEVPRIVKTMEGQHKATYDGRKKKGLYAPLDEITAIIDPVLRRHGLIYKFDRETYEGKEYEVCEVSHVGGHSERTRYPVGVDSGPGRTATQAVGSGDSYARRYALTAAFAITTFDPVDDDGAETQGLSEADRATVTDQQAANLKALFDEVDPTGGEERRCKASLKIKSLSEIKAKRFPDLLKYVEGQRRR